MIDVISHEDIGPAIAFLMGEHPERLSFAALEALGPTTWGLGESSPPYERLKRSSRRVRPIESRSAP